MFKIIKKECNEGSSGQKAQGTINLRKGDNIGTIKLLSEGILLSGLKIDVMSVEVDRVVTITRDRGHIVEEFNLNVFKTIQEGNM